MAQPQVFARTRVAGLGRPQRCALGQKSGCARNRTFWSSYPACWICSAHGCFLHLALRLAPTMPCTIPPPDVALYARMHDDAVWNKLAALVGEVPPQEVNDARGRRCIAGRGLLSAARTAPRCLSCASASRYLLRPARVSWLMGEAAPPVCNVQPKRALCSKPKAGPHARTRPTWRDIVEGARPPLDAGHRLRRLHGRSHTLCELATFTSASACFC